MVSNPTWNPDGEPYAVVERGGRWWHLVYVKHGLTRWGPGGYGWYVLSANRAEQKARRVLAAYLRLIAPSEKRIVGIDRPGYRGEWRPA